MSFSSIALFVYDVSRADDEAPSGHDRVVFTDRQTSVVTCIEQQVIASRIARTGQALAFFGAEKTTVFTWECTDVQGYVERFASVALTTEQLGRMLALDDGYEQLRSAMRRILPRSDHAVERQGGLRNNHGSMLLLSCDETSHEAPLRAYVERFRCQRVVLVPCRILDIVVMPPALIGQEVGCCWYRPSNCVDSERTIHVPRAAQDIARMHNAATIVAHMNARLTALPLSRLSASDYLKDTNVSADLLNAYLETQAAHRERATQELLEGRRTLEELERTRAGSLIARAEAQGVLRPFPELTVNDLRIPIYARVTSAYTDAVEEYQRSRALLESREQAVRDLVRDFLSAEVARANLRLQKRMAHLTILAVLAAVMAIVVGLTTDRMREALWIRAGALWDAIAHQVAAWGRAP